MAAKNRTTTQKAELVETGNIHLSFKRLQRISSNQACRRALYHAALMSGILDTHQERARLREILGLP